MTLSPYWLLFLTVLLPLPYSTDRRGRRFPWITYSLIALNVIAYLLTYHTPGAFERLGLIPKHPHFTALLTGIFLHVSVGHLFWNMVFLWLFGPHVEEAIGREAFLALYLGGGIAAGLLHMAIILARGEIVAVPLVGASGAISAILAPFAIRFHRAQIKLYWLPAALAFPSWSQLEVPAVAGLGLWLLQNIGGGLLFLWKPEPGGTAYWAHIGGFVFGLVAAELTGLLRDGRQDYLLQDARAAVAEGDTDAALRTYHTYLDRDPENAVVRAEMARLLAVGSDTDRVEARLEMLGATRGFLKQEDSPAAAKCAGDARALGLPLLLSPHERLRLAGAAEGTGDAETAITLLRAIMEETAGAPEDQMARLKLGQLLRRDHPQEAEKILTGFLLKYPQSEWVRSVNESLQKNV